MRQEMMSIVIGEQPASVAGPPASPGRRRRRVVVAALTALALSTGGVLAVVRPWSYSPPAPTVPFAQGVRALLATMSAAVASGDGARFTSVADPDRPATAEHLGTVFATLRSLPLESFVLAVDPQHDSDVSPEDGPDARMVPVQVTYQLRGFDAVPARAAALFVVAPDADGRWALRRDRTVGGNPHADSSRESFEPWLYDDADVARTGHVLVLGDRAHAREDKQLAEQLETMRAEVAQAWPGFDWNATVVAYARTDAPFQRSWGTTGEEGGSSSYAEVSPLPPARASDVLGAVRLVVTPDLLRDEDVGVDKGRAVWKIALRHELTHAATFRSSTGVPVWLIEGAAEYTGWGQYTGNAIDPLLTVKVYRLSGTIEGQLRAHAWQPALINGRGFYSGTADAVQQRYDGAFLACLYVGDHYGEATLRKLYAAAFAGPEVRQTDGAAHVEADATRALQSVLHMNHTTFEAKVAAYAEALYSAIR